MYQDSTWCKYVEIWKIIGGSVHNVRDDRVHLDKVLCAPIAPICSNSSRLHQKFLPTQIYRINCTERFSERSKSSHLLQKLPFVQPYIFRSFPLIIDFFSKFPVILTHISLQSSNGFKLIRFISRKLIHLIMWAMYSQKRLV